MTVQNYLTYFNEMVAPTEALFRMVPEDKLHWKPTEKSFSAAQLMTHMGEALRAYAGGITSGDWGFESMREVFVTNRKTRELTVEEAVELYKANLEVYRQKIGALTEEEFDRGEIDSPQLGRVPRWRAAMLAVEHHVNHKAELFMYLKFIGSQVNTGHLYSDRRKGE
jgi:uncharacterized damage-inducible protein DinB